MIFEDPGRGLIVVSLFLISSWPAPTFLLFYFFYFLETFLPFPASEPAGSRNPSETQGIIRDSAKLGFMESMGSEGLRGPGLDPEV